MIDPTGRYWPYWTPLDNKPWRIGDHEKGEYVRGKNGEMLRFNNFDGAIKHIEMYLISF